METKNFALKFHDALWSKHGPTGVRGQATSSTLRCVLSAIAKRANYVDGRNSFVSAQTISDMTGIKDHDTIYRAITLAEQQGWLEKCKGNPFSGRGNTYHLLIPEHAESNQNIPENSGYYMPGNSGDRHKENIPDNSDIPDNSGLDIPGNSGTTSTCNPSLSLEQGEEDNNGVDHTPEGDTTPPPTEEQANLSAQTEQSTIRRNPQPNADPTLGTNAQRAQDIVSEVAARLGAHVSPFELESLALSLMKRNILDDRDDEVFINALEDEARSKAGRIRNPRSCLKYAIADVQVQYRPPGGQPGRVELVDPADLVDWDLLRREMEEGVNHD